MTDIHYHFPQGSGVLMTVSPDGTQAIRISPTNTGADEAQSRNMIDEVVRLVNANTESVVMANTQKLQDAIARLQARDSAQAQAWLEMRNHAADMENVNNALGAQLDNVKTQLAAAVAAQPGSPEAQKAEADGQAAIDKMADTLDTIESANAEVKQVVADALTKNDAAPNPPPAPTVEQTATNLDVDLSAGAAAGAGGSPAAQPQGTASTAAQQPGNDQTPAPGGTRG